VKQATNGAAKASTGGSSLKSMAQETRMDPIVTSLGKVGGGGYSSGTLDAQRENNRLTGETNRLLTDMSRKIEKLGGSGGLAAFG
jgi:hypothetical protein